MKDRQTLVIGVLVNPYAGIGGSVALKGSDGEATREEALRRGAIPQAPLRMTRALASLANASHVTLLTWAGQMGEQSCRDAGLPCQVIGESAARVDVPQADPVSPYDLLATVLEATKIGRRTSTIEQGRRTDITWYERGRPIPQLF